MSNLLAATLHRPANAAPHSALGHLDSAPRTACRATRESFTVSRPYAGRLSSVRRRPVENSTRSLALLRLEFAIYSLEECQRRLNWLGKTACRDLVVIPGAALDDFGLAAFVLALQVERPERLESWLRLPQQNRWVKIVFGELAAEDDRNTFASIVPFDTSGYALPNRMLVPAERFVRPGIAADDLDTSKSTVLRRVDALEPEWGASLVRRTKGRQRRVNLSLLRHLWQRRQ